MNWGYIYFSGGINLNGGKQKLATSDVVNRDFDIIIVDQNGIRKYKPNPLDTIEIRISPGDVVNCRITGENTDINYPVQSMRLKFMELPSYIKERQLKKRKL